MAGDLRIIAAVIHIITDLERMADHAAGIAKINLLHGDQPLLKPLIDIPRMADKCRDMLRRSMDAFLARDAEAARRIAAEDDEVDQLYDQVYHELVMFMVSDPQDNRAGYLAPVGRPQPGAHRRPRDQHLRASRVSRDRSDGGDERLDLLTILLAVFDARPRLA